MKLMARTPQAAAAWSLAYGSLGLYWTSGGAGYPFELAPGEGFGGFFDRVDPAVGSAFIAGAGFLSFLLALAMMRATVRPGLRTAMLVAGWSLAVFLALIVPDARVLQNIAYGLLFYFGNIDWPVANQALVMIGGVVWGLATLSFQRRTRSSCEYCGRGGSETTMHALLQRWAKPVTYVAALAPLPYALSRTLLALGGPIGFSDEFLTTFDLAAAQWWQKLFVFGLAGLCIMGAVLTIGLIQPWGETFPRWLPVVGGRRVPPKLALVPASIVAVTVTATTIKFVPGWFAPSDAQLDNWGAWLPGVFWPLWGPALGAAAVAYYYRRRDPCARCSLSGRGTAT